MEAVFLILIGAALFSQAWHMMGMYSDGRTVAVFVGGLGILSFIALVLDPMLLTGSGDKTISAANHLSEITVLKVLIITWALYCIGVGAQALWDFEERAVGFYSLVVAVVTAFSFLNYAGVLEPRYGENILGRSLRGYAASVDHVDDGVLRSGVHVHRYAVSGVVGPVAWGRNRRGYWIGGRHPRDLLAWGGSHPLR